MNTPTQKLSRESIVGKHVKNISDFHLRDMKLGDTFTTAGLLRGISTEPISWRLVETSTSGIVLTFDLFYFGIQVGEAKLYPLEVGKVTVTL